MSIFIVMENGFQFRCYPTPEQKKILLQWIGCQRCIYNAKVSEDRYFRSFKRKSLQHVGETSPIDQQYSQFKSELTPWLSLVPSQVLRNGATRWMQAYSRFFKGLGGRPKFKTKNGTQSVWLTSELFSFKRDLEAEPRAEIQFKLFLGKGKFPVGQVRYVAHRQHQIPAAITISIDAGQWYISFCNIDEVATVKPEEVAKELATWPEEKLLAATTGIDRGIAIAACSSTGDRFHYSAVQLERMSKKDKAKRRWQRRMARRIKGSGGWRKAKFRAGKCQQYAKRVRKDFAHKTSCQLVDAENASTRLIVFEALQVNNMTRKPKAKKNEAGQYLPNKARAKAGLNAKILASSWGKIKEYAEYKALRAQKLVISIPAHHTSQECSRCGCIHKDNRLSQAEFVCQRCGFIANADDNASVVIKQRGVQFILSGAFKLKEKKKTMRTKKKVGAERPEPAPETEPTPMETWISHALGNQAVHGSVKLETLAKSETL